MCRADCAGDRPDARRRLGLVLSTSLTWIRLAAMASSAPSDCTSNFIRTAFDPIMPAATSSSVHAMRISSPRFVPTPSAVASTSAKFVQAAADTLGYQASACPRRRARGSGCQSCRHEMRDLETIEDPVLAFADLPSCNRRRVSRYTWVFSSHFTCTQACSAASNRVDPYVRRSFPRATRRHCGGSMLSESLLRRGDCRRRLH